MPHASVGALARTLLSIEHGLKIGLGAGRLRRLALSPETDERRVLVV